MSEEWRIEPRNGQVTEHSDLLEALTAYRAAGEGRLLKRALDGEWLLIAWGKAKRSATAIDPHSGQKVKVWI